MPVKVDLRNFEITRARLSGSGFTEGLLEGGKDIVDLASQLAPKETERLAGSGKAEIVSDGRVEISFGNDLPDNRAIAQEFGTMFMEAQPYLWPAIMHTDILFHVRDKIL
jgi:HK97 gp10 family phage protein